MNAIAITINNTCDTQLSFDIQEWTNKVLNYLNQTPQHMEITLLSKPDIQKLNLEYFNNDCPTDTISFNLNQLDKIVGDIYLCPKVIEENAHAWENSIEKEFKIVIIHSILHLIGFEDDTEANALKMKNEQNKIFCKLTD